MGSFDHGSSDALPCSCNFIGADSAAGPQQPKHISVVARIMAPCCM